MPVIFVVFRLLLFVRTYLFNNVSLVKQGVEFPHNLTKAKLKKILEKQQKACADCRGIEAQLSESLRDESRRFAEIWQELASGERDDERLALALWPERVINCCCEDIELARVHELDGYFWLTDRDGAPCRRLEPDVEIRNEVKFRTSPAVKAALTSPLEAPVPSGSGKKRNASKRQTISCKP